ncbi:hypothetical protein BD780_001922 [Clostridium tetanomorphum]|uniref:Uncharacterized protein n=1 Tax=Clostridium tetanomorphum TaxID=1553 RepID=A0A923EDT9_CLOTT|nr:hypothetical protein [Clostridium tetanomorphum]KAJ51516.1 hypothetical protein CTM_12200 [Clostridium tetanomorphum DSM 665]MBC2398868.1 hypothetical protein [Clostridium tetanomorphum]MBP1865164.1 hypothetical protein [Clostridium tetanomorphum]NRS84697.1 hypothetical protein [Clostridium tetanomorphum]NRZ97912.1 hypothetical protein [Clostridium tetanomorphum]
MAKWCKCKKNIGLIIASIGTGIIITFIIPIWGWIIAVGGGLIYAGWYLNKHCK